MFEAICGKPRDWRVFDTERDAIAYARRFQYGEVQRVSDGVRVWGRLP